MAVASWQDLVDIGAIPGDGVSSDPKWARAVGLLEKASAQALSFLALDEDDIAEWPEADRVTLATIVAEIAARRLTTSAAQSAAQMQAGYTPGWQTAVLTKTDRQNLSRITAVGRMTSGTVEVAFASSNPVEWDGWPSIGALSRRFS